MTDLMTGRVVLVTAAASELGRAIALDLAACDAHVVVADSDGTGAKDTVVRVEDAGGSAEGVELDVDDRDQVEDVLRVVFRDYAEKFDGLVSIDPPGSTFPSQVFVEGRLGHEDAEEQADLVHVTPAGTVLDRLTEEIRAEARERGWPLRVSVVGPATADGDPADVAALVRTAVGCSPG